MQMTKNHTISSLLSLVLQTFLMGTVAGCAPPGPGVELQLVTLQNKLDVRGSSVAPGAAPAGIDAFRLCVQTNDGKAESCKDFADLNDSSYRIDGLPVGDNWIVTFQGYSITDQKAIWCGRARGVVISDKKTTKVRMLLTRCGDFTDTLEQPVTPRVFHTAGLRPDGRVVVAGGFTTAERSNECSQPCESLKATDNIEIYTHETGSFGEANGTLTHARGAHVSMVLPDGRLLVAGGCEQASLQNTYSDPERPGPALRCMIPGEAATTAELFSPESGSSIVVDIPGTVFAGSVELSDHELLLLGGQDENGTALKRALWLSVEGDDIKVTSIEGALLVPRVSPAVVRFSKLGDVPAEILVVGGAPSESRSEPGQFAERLAFQAGSIFSQVPRSVDEMYDQGMPVVFSSAALSTFGKIIVCGGMFPGAFMSDDTPFIPSPIDMAMSFDMRTDSAKVVDVVSNLLTPRVFHSLTRVDLAGHVLVLGGMNSISHSQAMGFKAHAGVEWWDDEAGYFSLRWANGDPVQMLTPRAGHTATMLKDGNVLIIGGTDGNTILNSAEMFNSAPQVLSSEGLPPI